MKLILPTLTLVSFISADRNSRIQNLLTTLKSQLENTPVNANDENAPFPMMGNQMGRKINSNDVQIIKGTCLPRKFATIGRHGEFRADKGK